MKKLIQLFCISSVFALLPCAVSGQNLYDGFNGTFINTNIWEIILPFPQSQVTESGGSLTTTGRGTLATIAGFDSPVTVSGAVTLNNQSEHFQTVLRTDLSVWPPDASSHELTGIIVGFSADGNQVSIQQFTTGQQNPIILASTSFSFVVGQPYNFSISDDKTNITLTINGTLLLSGTSSFASGDQIAFESRELAGSSSSLDFIQITGPTIGLIKSVKPSFSYLSVGTNYQLQISTDLKNWNNQGEPFTATNSNIIYPQYFDVGNWNQLFFRVLVSP